MEQIYRELGFTRRYDKDGNELKKPDYWDKWIDKSIKRTGLEPDDWFVMCEAYEKSEEVVYTPNFMRFWERVSNSNLLDKAITRLTDKAYDNLSEPLQLHEFIPVDSEGNILEEPREIKCCSGLECGCQGRVEYDFGEVHEYQEASKKVIYRGWKVKHGDHGSMHIVNGDQEIAITKNGVLRSPITYLEYKTKNDFIKNGGELIYK